LRRLKSFRGSDIHSKVKWEIRKFGKVEGLPARLKPRNRLIGSTICHTAYALKLAVGH
jgi:hypothetical protein